MPGKKKTQKNNTKEQPSEQEAEHTFPIVGIGASAGGLEAFETFFKHMPSDSSIAFVLVQHLAPTHESMLVDLLKRFTRMDVVQVEDGMKVEPNFIYIIPPNRDMALMRRTLHLLEPVERRGFRLPIDFLFRSLAEDLAERAICIVLSGTGSDGTLGLKEIRGVGGMTMVQTPETAKYDGMPRSAIATGLVDYVLPPQQMPEQLLNYIKRLNVSGAKPVAPPLHKEIDSLEKIFLLLRSQTKHDFSLYKQNTINRRIERRMAVNQINRIADYVRYLRQTPLEIDTLFRELLIGVTSFFRDAEAFDVLEQQAIPQLIANRRINQPVRIWIPGCSTGEEAYSIAMLIREQMSIQQREFEVQIFATDIDDQAIEKARSGLYPDSIVADVSPERLQRFFVKDNNTYQVSKQIREMVVFAVQSIIKDPPFSKMDLISCRNLLIYLGPELQKKVIPLFHYALRLNGFLFLGTSETLGEFDRYFQAVDRKAKLFQRITGEAVPQGRLDFTTPSLTNDEALVPPSKADKVPNVRELTEKLLLKDYTPPAVIINEQSDILFFHGHTSDYLEPASGEASFNILAMAREGLRLPLTTAIRKAFAQRQAVVHENINLQIEGKPHVVNVIVNPVTRSAMPGLFMVVFQDVSRLNREEPIEGSLDVTDERDQQLAAAERELQATREYLQTTIEELETTNEELKSTNEELQSSNEELQSTNEELETAKEELQSVNEELITVNSEMQSKVDDLIQANNDLSNLLANVELGIIFLDMRLHIQRFNPAATQLINLIATDVGRPVGHIVPNLLYDDLEHDAQQVMDTLIPKEVEIQAKDERWFKMRIRPYRTVNNAIDGLVIIFAEITEQKQVAAVIQAAREYAENIIATLREPLLVLDAKLRVVSASHAFYRDFQVLPEQVEGQLIYDLGNGQWDIPQLRELLEQVLPENQLFEDFEMEHDFPMIGRRKMLLNARQMRSESGQTQLILLAIEDMTNS